MRMLSPSCLWAVATVIPLHTLGPPQAHPLSRSLSLRWGHHCLYNIDQLHRLPPPTPRLATPRLESHRWAATMYDNAQCYCIDVDSVEWGFSRCDPLPLTWLLYWAFFVFNGALWHPVKYKLLLGSWSFGGGLWLYLVSITCMWPGCAYQGSHCLLSDTPQYQIMFIQETVYRSPFDTL